jgi:FixJ family two-component response regulator
VSVPEVSLISIVDDDESVGEALQSLMKSVGFQTAVFASAEDFLNSGDLNDTACLILDVRMPGMSGLELQAELAASNRRIPIIFVSAHTPEEARARALAAGAVAFLLKPFSEDALLGAVDLSLGIHRSGASDRPGLDHST